ncbi:MAG: hypothetical protein R3Y54_11015, partial [Eubacteriales bacterium]
MEQKFYTSGGIMTGVFGEKLDIKNLYKYVVLVAISLIPMSIAMFFRSTPMIAYILILVSAFFTMCV